MNQKRLAKIIFGVILFLSVSLVLGVTGYLIKNKSKLPAESARPSNPIATGLTIESIKNAEYTFGGDQAVKLKDGSYNIEYPDSASVSHFGIFDNKISLGDLNNDGKDEAAVILDNYGGGSGHFYYLAAVVNRNGKPVNIALADLGDRVIVNSVEIKNGKIIIDMVVQGSDDGLCCPSLRKIFEYELQEGRLIKTREYDYGEIGAVDISAWETYRNDKYGFEFKYPSDWSYKETIPQPSNYGLRVIFKDSKDKIELTYDQPIPEVGHEAWILVKTEKAGLFTKTLFKPKPEYKDYGNLIFAEWYGNKFKNSGQFGFNYEEENDPRIKILDQILSTFKFIN